MSRKFPSGARRFTVLAATGSLLAGVLATLGLFAAPAGALTGPEITASPASIAFGNVAVGASAVQELTFQDLEDPLTHPIRAAQFNGIAITGKNAADFALESTFDCETPPFPDSCTINIGFSPSVTGPEKAKITFTGNFSTPTTTGTVTIPLTGTGTQAAILISPASIPAATEGQPYGPVTISWDGGVAPYSFNVIGFAATTLTSTQTGSNSISISGTPTVSGTFPVTLSLQDSSTPPALGSETFNILINPPPLAFGPATLPTGFQGQAYTGAVSVSPTAQGQGNKTVSIYSGSLPPGLSLNSLTGAITGTPSTPGTYTFGAELIDSATPPQVAKQTYSITILQQPLTLLSAALPQGTIGTPYSTPIVATGGTKPYVFEISSGALPPGLNINPSTGVISGTPLGPNGSDGFDVTVSDSESPAQTYTLTYNISIDNLALPAATLPNGSPENAYSATVAATGGGLPYSYTLDTGALPPGLTVDSSTGTISGVPTAPGVSTFQIEVTDSFGVTVAQSYSITITSISLSPSTLPNGSLGVKYSQSLSASGGAPPYTYGLSAGNLPPGLALDSVTGKLSGTPTQAGTFSFQVNVFDSASNTIQAVAQNYTITISALTLSPSTLPNGNVGTPYSATVTASGGKHPYTYVIQAGGNLPAGLTLNNATGAITGTPTAAGTSNVVVLVQDSSGTPIQGTQGYSVTIAAAGPLTVSNAALPDAKVGVTYSTQLGATGGTAPYTWQATSSLPAGLTLSSAGVLSGKTTAKAAIYTFTVLVRDSLGNTVRGTETLTVKS